MRTLLAAMIALLVVGIAPPAQSASIEETFAKVSPAVGALYAQTASGSMEFLCTVTAVNKTEKHTEILTANHCVRKDVSYVVTFDGKMLHSARVFKVPAEDIDPQKYRRQYGQPTTDAALFVIDQVLDIPVVPLGNDADLSPGRSIVTVGYPLGVTKIRYMGIIAGRFERPGDGMDGYHILQIFGAPGSSGSAVIEEATGSVIGVLVAARQALGTPVIFATPISYLKFLRPVPGMVE